MLHVSFGTGYPIAFGDRMMVLQCLYDTIGSKDRIVLSKRVTNVKHSEKGVTVTAKTVHLMIEVSSSE
jgi:hypothetical protein